jgi:hypothetical protein
MQFSKVTVIVDACPLLQSNQTVDLTTKTFDAADFRTSPPLRNKACDRAIIMMLLIKIDGQASEFFDTVLGFVFEHCDVIGDHSVAYAVLRYRTTTDPFSANLWPDFLKVLTAVQSQLLVKASIW